MTGFETKINELIDNRKKEEQAEIDTFKCIIKAFKEKWDTDTIYFDLDKYCPFVNISKMGDDDTAYFIKSMTFTEDNDIATLIAHSYYWGEECVAKKEDAEPIDYMDLLMFINDQIEERYLPQEDEDVKES